MTNTPLMVRFWLLHFFNAQCQSGLLFRVLEWPLSSEKRPLQKSGLIFRFRVFGFRVFGLSGFRGFGISGFRDFGFSGFRVFGFSGFRDFGFSGFRDSGFQDFRISRFRVFTLDMDPAKVRDQSDAFSGFSYFQVQTIERRCTAPLRLVHCVYRREIDIVQTCTNK